MTDINIIDDLVARARVAQHDFEAEATASHEILDRASEAVAWALMEKERNASLAAFAVAETGLGNVADKIKKNHRKTLGLLRDLKGVKTFGHIEDDKEKGISLYYRPKGVVAAIVPSTNPLATPINNAVNAIKTGNAIILAPSPKGAKPLEVLLGYVHEELARLGLSEDLVQMVPNPPSKEKTARLMALADVLVVTGSQNNVRQAYSSGTPAIGVGMGNVVTIIDETADLSAAAEKIAASKTFDNATSCSSENAVIAVDDVYDGVVSALRDAGGYILSPDEVEHLEATYFTDSGMNRGIMAQDMDKVLSCLGFNHIPQETRFLVAPTDKVGKPHKISGEKMARFLALYRAADFTDAAYMAKHIQEGQGAGHSVGIHTADDTRAHDLAMILHTCRVIVNQAHCFATGGSFDNGLPFSLSMGCGSWGGNSIDDNFNWKHLINKTQIVRTIPPQEPSVDEIFADYFRAAGYR